MRHKVDTVKLRHLIEVEQLQQRVVGEKLGVPENTVWYYCKKLGLKTQRSGPKSGELHPDWKGGVKMSKGYRYIYSPLHPFRTKQNYVAEHRLVMEQKIQRYLLPKEVVHHIDGNPLNNEIENLVLFSSNADHLRSELLGKIPNWTPSGWKRICETDQEKANRRKLKSCGGQQPQ